MRVKDKKAHRIRSVKMSTTADIDFWFTMGSTYSCLSAMRIPEVERTTGVKINWRPFSLRTILQEMKHIPFADKPVKCAYMWRDIQRRAEMYGIVVRVPAPYPLKENALANKIALIGMQEGWGKEFVRASYRRWFQQGEESGSEPNVSASLRECGQDPERVLDLARSEQSEHDLSAHTDEARKLNIFGSPTFVVGSELFWGDDRLEDAISWVKYGRVQR
jgi:2-hydroxychromene-2-carboxylate isomerase